MERGPLNQIASLERENQAAKLHKKGCEMHGLAALQHSTNEAIKIKPVSAEKSSILYYFDKVSKI